METSAQVCVYLGPELAHYGFSSELDQGHPFSTQRMQAFEDEFRRSGLDKKVCICEPHQASVDEIQRFHDRKYIEQVMAQSETGEGFLDYGDTPAFPGAYEAAATVVGTALAATEAVMRGQCARAFVPIAGLHHARRDSAAGFCVFNDCGVVIETLLQKYGLRRIAYIDIDAHHGDGVFYAFEGDKRVIFADLHEDGRYLYPGTGASSETGTGAAKGTKLNIPMQPGARDEDFMRQWPKVEQFITEHKPEFILLQCGADSLQGDPITDMAYSEASHAHAARQLSRLASELCQGRLLALGGGGYNLDNIARSWTAVVKSFIDVR